MPGAREKRCSLGQSVGGEHEEKVTNSIRIGGNEFNNGLDIDSERARFLAPIT